MSEIQFREDMTNAQMLIEVRHMAENEQLDILAYPHEDGINLLKKILEDGNPLLLSRMFEMCYLEGEQRALRDIQGTASRFASLHTRCAKQLIALQKESDNRNE